MKIMKLKQKRAGKQAGGKAGEKPVPAGYLFFPDFSSLFFTPRKFKSQIAIVFAPRVLQAFVCLRCILKYLLIKY